MYTCYVGLVWLKYVDFYCLGSNHLRNQWVGIIMQHEQYLNKWCYMEYWHRLALINNRSLTYLVNCVRGCVNHYWVLLSNRLKQLIKKNNSKFTTNACILWRALSVLFHFIWLTIVIKKTKHISLTRNRQDRR